MSQKCYDDSEMIYVKHVAHLKDLNIIIDKTNLKQFANIHIAMD